MSLSHDARRAVERMLLQMFSLSEMRRLVRYLPNGGQMSAELPGRWVSPRDMAEAVVEVLNRNQALDGAFFDAVIEERPRRRHEVEEVRDIVAQSARQPSPATGPAPSSAPLRQALLERVRGLRPFQLEELAFNIGLDLDVVDASLSPPRQTLHFIVQVERRGRLEELERALDKMVPLRDDTPSTPLPPKRAPSGGYDVFLGYSQVDKAVARRLYTALSEVGLSVFFDEVSLLPGDHWPTAIQRAMEEARVALIVHSEQTRPGFYQLEETTDLIARMRAPGANRRLVPIFVERAPGPNSKLSYGLRNLHGLVLADEGAQGIAQKIKTLVDRMAGSTPLPASGSERPADTPRRRPKPPSADHPRPAPANTRQTAPSEISRPVHILHLSDLHLEPDNSWESEDLLQRLVEVVADEVCPERPLDAIAVTGDLASKGQPAEYEQVRLFLNDLLDASGLTAARLFVVPGNHDIDRSRTDEEAIQHLEARLRSAKTGELNKLLDRAFNRDTLALRYGAYHQFLTDLGVAHPIEGSFAHQLKVRGHKIHIAGLDTAWLHSSDGAQGSLVLGARALSNALRNARKADVTVALAHHPLSWLTQQDQAAVLPRLQRDVDVLLRGHLHEPTWSIASGMAGDLVELPAGSAYATSQWANAVQVVSLWPGEQRGEVVSWGWRPNEYDWRKDLNASGRGRPNGVWDFKWKRRRARARKGSTQD